MIRLELNPTSDYTWKSFDSTLPSSKVTPKLSPSDEALLCLKVFPGLVVSPLPVLGPQLRKSTVQLLGFGCHCASQAGGKCWWFPPRHSQAVRCVQQNPRFMHNIVLCKKKIQNYSVTSNHYKFSQLLTPGGHCASHPRLRLPITRTSSGRIIITLVS